MCLEKNKRQGTYIPRAQNTPQSALYSALQVAIEIAFAIAFAFDDCEFTIHLQLSKNKTGNCYLNRKFNVTTLLASLKCFYSAFVSQRSLLFPLKPAR